jgi:hypothetical protein
MAGYMAKAQDTFYSNPKFVTGNVRSNVKGAPTILSDMRKLVDDDDDFLEIETYISPQISRTESIDTLIKEINSEIGVNIRNKFGRYTPYVIQETALAIHHQLKRKCNISRVAHWVGSSGLTWYLQATGFIPPHPNPDFRPMVTFSHDFKEDLPRVALDKYGNVYGLYRTEEFGRDYLPQEKDLIGNTSVLTNLYTEITKYAYESLRSQKVVFTQDTFSEYLKDYMRSETNRNDADNTLSMSKIHDNLLKFMAKKNYSNLSGRDLLDAISWGTYDYYATRIVNKSIKYNDDTSVIAKDCDLSYNFMGKDILSDVDLTQNLLKLWIFPSAVYASKMNLPHTNAFVEELLEDALCYSQYYVIKDFMKTEANILFNTSKFNKIIDLAPIFYKDITINSAYDLKQSPTK